MKVKHFLISTCICATILSPAYFNLQSNPLTISNTEIVREIDYNNSFKKLNILKESSAEEVAFSISDSNLANRMMTLLGKSENSFFPSDLINHEDYKTTKVENGIDLNDDPIYEISANKYLLDLSYANIQNITELSQFVWPETLNAIDLSGNNIDETHTDRIVSLMALDDSSEDIVIDEKTYPVNANFAGFVKIVNLNFNNITLSKLSEINLNNTRMLYGIQKFKSGIYNNNDLPGEIFISSLYDSFLNFEMSVNYELKTLNKNTITNLKDYGLGDYVMKISSPENSPFADYEKMLIFSNFKTYIKDTFKVERKSLFKINKNDIVVEGLNEGFTISPNNASTKDIGESFVNITITTSTKSWEIPLSFKVVDNTPPTLKLKGGETVYLAVNGATYIEYGCIGMDSGDDISHNIKITGKVDITTPGDYYITYNLADDSGNVATEIKRKVVVQEYALKNVLIQPLENEYFTDKEIVLTSNLPAGADLSKYKNLKYTWYYNGQEFITTTGDKLTGKSSTTILESDAKKINVYVVLTATLNDDSTESYVSEVLELDVKKDSKGLPSIIISILLALSILIIVFVVVIIEKKKRNTHNKGNSKKKDNKKKSNKKDKDKKSKGAFDNYDNIQVIKNYGDSNDDPPANMQN